MEPASQILKAPLGATFNLNDMPLLTELPPIQISIRHYYKYLVPNGDEDGISVTDFVFPSRTIGELSIN